MKKIFSMIFILTISSVSGQDILPVKICEKIYSSDSIISDSSSTLFGTTDLFFESSCSWTCNSLIRISNTLDNKNYMLDSLGDFDSYTSTKIKFPLNKKIIFKVYLEKYTILFGDTLGVMDDSEVFLRGFQISNGDRKSKKTYCDFSRAKRVKVYVNNNLLGIAYLKDTPKVQYIDFLKSYPLSSEDNIEISIEVIELYNGKKYDILAISELHLDGDGGHSLTDKFCKRD